MLMCLTFKVSEVCDRWYKHAHLVVHLNKDTPEPMGVGLFLFFHGVELGGLPINTHTHTHPHAHTHAHFALVGQNGPRA